MLIVTRLKLSNICQYTEIDIPIMTGLMAVCGRNGSGKSTLLRGLMYGLTGLVDGSWGTQQNLQRDGCAVPGYVVVTLKDDTSHRELIIKRFSVSGAKFPDSITEFKDGQYTEVALRRKTVDAYLGDLYGISCALLFQLVWGRQGQLDMLLTAPAAYVSTFLSSVWNTKYLETLRDRLKSAIDTVAVMSDPDQDILNTAKELNELEDSIHNSEVQLETTEAQLAQLYSQKEELEKKVSASSLEDAKKRATLQGQMQQLEIQIRSVLMVLEKRDLDMIKDKTLEELGNTYTTARDRVVHAQNIIATKKQEVASIENQIKLADMEKRGVVHERANLKATKERIEAVVNYENTTCEFCGGQIQNMNEYRSHVCAKLGYDDPAVLDQRLSDKAQSEAIIAKHILDLGSDKERAEILLEDWQKNLKGYQEIEASAKVNLDTAQYLQRYNEYDTQYRALEEELLSCSDTAVDETLASNLKAVTLQITSAEQQKEFLQRKQAQDTGRTAELKRVQEKLEAEKEQFDVNSSARKVLIQLRDVFSQQRAQARYFASKAVELNQHLAAFLELSGMTFNLRLDPDTRIFSYTTEDGYEHPTAHLSGAQKNISAVALQMALVEVIKPNINLFLFDEPSESLDVENKIVMSELFRRMNRLLPSIGGTMLIVSRDEQLIESCENIININQKEEELNEARSS